MTQLTALVFWTYGTGLGNLYIAAIYIMSAYLIREPVPILGYVTNNVIWEFWNSVHRIIGS